MNTTPLSRLADALNIDIAAMDRTDAQNAVCEAAIALISEKGQDNNEPRQSFKDAVCEALISYLLEKYVRDLGQWFREQAEILKEDKNLTKSDFCLDVVRNIDSRVEKGKHHD